MAKMLTSYGNLFSLDPGHQTFEADSQTQAGYGGNQSKIQLIVRLLYIGEDRHGWDGAGPGSEHCNSMSPVTQHC